MTQPILAPRIVRVLGFSALIIAAGVVLLLLFGCGIWQPPQPKTIAHGFKAWISGDGPDPYAPLNAVAIGFVILAGLAVTLGIALERRIVVVAGAALVGCAAGCWVLRIVMGVLDVFVRWGLLAAVGTAVIVGALWLWGHVRIIEPWLGLDLNRDGKVGDPGLATNPPTGATA